MRIERVKFKPLTGKQHGVVLHFHNLDDLDTALSALAASRYEGLWGFEVDIVYRTLKITTSLPDQAETWCTQFQGFEWPSEKDEVSIDQ